MFNNWQNKLWLKLIAVTLSMVFLFSETAWTVQTSLYFYSPGLILLSTQVSQDQHTSPKIISRILHGINSFLTPDVYAQGEKEFGAYGNFRKMSSFNSKGGWKRTCDVAPAESSPLKVSIQTSVPSKSFKETLIKTSGLSNPPNKAADKKKTEPEKHGKDVSQKPGSSQQPPGSSQKPDGASNPPTRQDNSAKSTFGQANQPSQDYGGQTQTNTGNRSINSDTNTNTLSIDHSNGGSGITSPPANTHNTQSIPKSGNDTVHSNTSQASSINSSFGASSFTSGNGKSYTAAVNKTPTAETSLSATPSLNNALPGSTTQPSEQKNYSEKTASIPAGSKNERTQTNKIAVEKSAALADTTQNARTEKSHDTGTQTPAKNNIADTSSSSRSSQTAGNDNTQEHIGKNPDLNAPGDSADIQNDHTFAHGQKITNPIGLYFSHKYVIPPLKNQVIPPGYRQPVEQSNTNNTQENNTYKTGGNNTLGIITTHYDITINTTSVQIHASDSRSHNLWKPVPPKGPPRDAEISLSLSLHSYNRSITPKISPRNNPQHSSIKLKNQHNYHQKYPENHTIFNIQVHSRNAEYAGITTAPPGEPFRYCRLFSITIRSNHGL